MKEKLLKKIIQNISGQGTEQLVDLLYDKKNVNEFLIAKKLGTTINQTRNILYKLADEGLIRFVRKKDKKKGGWYTYFWTLEVKKILVKHKEKIDNEISELANQLKTRENSRFYVCKNCHLEYDEENALLNEYTCQECGETLETKENGALLNQIKNEITRLRLTEKEVAEYIEEIESKENKTIKRRTKLELKKKTEERAKKRKAAQKEREKLKKKSTKAVKKKPSKKKKKNIKKKKKL